MGWNACAAAGERGRRVRLRPSAAHRNAYSYHRAYAYRNAYSRAHAYAYRNRDSYYRPHAYA